MAHASAQTGITSSEYDSEMKEWKHVVRAASSSTNSDPELATAVAMAARNRMHRIVAFTLTHRSKYQMLNECWHALKKNYGDEKSKRVLLMHRFTLTWMNWRLKVGAYVP